MSRTSVSFGGAAAGGSDFITDRPQLLFVGEAGRERVTVSPLGNKKAPIDPSLQGGGDTINFHFSGDLSGISQRSLTAMVRRAMASYSKTARKRRANDARRRL